MISLFSDKNSEFFPKQKNEGMFIGVDYNFRKNFDVGL